MMFIIFLRFAAHRDQTSAFMMGHQSGIEQGVADGVDDRLRFLLEDA